MLKASGAMAAATLTSRLLGMVREMEYGYFMGTTWVASAFLLAFASAALPAVRLMRMDIATALSDRE